CVQNKQSSTTVLSNIENTLYNGTNFYNSAPNGDSAYKNNSAPNGDSLYRNNSSATNGGDSLYKNNSSAPGGDCTNDCVQNKQSSTTVLSNIENTLYNGTNFYNSAPNGDSAYKNNSAPNGDSLYRNNSSATNGGDSLYKNNSSAPGGDCTNELDKAEAEARLCKLRQELDRKRIFIKNMKMSLDTVDSSDNIDIRIQHAELEYQLGKEELNLLNILEEFRNLQNSLENNFNKSDSYFHESLSIYNYIVQHCASADTLTLHAVQIPYDSKCPKFGLSYRDENHGLFVEWTSEEGGGSGLELVAFRARLHLSQPSYIVQHCASADTLTLHAVQIPYDSKCPKFGLSYRDENHGLFVEWTSEEGGGSGLCKGDRN
ncbi:uncharacterized protein LOC103519624, partial [Diaphorina citri]|uniref:Uncharacterized protein LOC103519624 n=1 Tax=Diaphorina citri TaxID=121845 RepID=A0A3Q0JEI7_DIACI